MRKEYDFSRATRNPYAKRLKRQVTIRLDRATIAYFKALSDDRHSLSNPDQPVPQRLRDDSEEARGGLAGPPGKGRSVTVAIEQTLRA